MRVEPKTVVGIEFTMKQADGTILESSEGKGPLEYLHGVGMPLPPGLIQAIEGMAVDEAKSVVLTPDLAFGNRDDSLVVELERARFGNNPVEVGMGFMANLDDMIEAKHGMRRYFIKEVGDQKVVLDGNFELAGKTLHFDIKVVSVRAAELTELSHGHPHQSGGCCGGGGCGSGEGSEGGCCSTEQPAQKSEGGCGTGGCGCSH